MPIDLNCDMGEGFGPWPMGQDGELMQYISSANIACGFHAGDPLVMRSTLRLALKHHVALGAHPGFPDLQGFGRRNMHLSAEETQAMVLYQIGALQAIAKAEGGQLRHVKPHGALYNMAAKDRALADAIAKAVRLADPALLLYGLSGSALIAAGQAAGLGTVSEVFADRRYLDDGSLVPRNQPNALIESVEEAVAQALRMAQAHTVHSISGQAVAVRAETICLHGDSPGALAFATALHQALRSARIELKAPGG